MPREQTNETSETIVTKVPIEPRIEMVLNFNLARGVVQDEFRKAERHSGRETPSRDLTRGFGRFELRINVLAKRQGWRQVQGPVVAEGLGACYRFSPSSRPRACCQETCTPPFATPPLNVILWESTWPNLEKPIEIRQAGSRQSAQSSLSPAFCTHSATLAMQDIQKGRARGQGTTWDSLDAYA